MHLFVCLSLPVGVCVGVILDLIFLYFIQLNIYSLYNNKHDLFPTFRDQLTQRTVC